MSNSFLCCKVTVKTHDSQHFLACLAVLKPQKQKETQGSVVISFMATPYSFRCRGKKQKYRDIEIKRLVSDRATTVT